MTEHPSQPPLPFPPRRLCAVPFIEGAANAAACARLAAWQAALGKSGRALSVVLAVTGAEGAGTSAFLGEAARRLGTVARGPEADFDALLADEPAAIAVDDVQALPPLDLFALIEAAAARRLPLVLAGRAPLSGWAAHSGEGSADPLPDLVNRLRSIAHIEIGAPDEDMLARFLQAELDSRGLRLPAHAVAAAASNLRREWGAAKGFAGVVERLAAGGYKKPGPLLRDALAEAAPFTL